MNTNISFRCAVHFHSQKFRNCDISLYKELRDASISVSDGILKSISVLQCGKKITIENNRANFHLEEQNGDLSLYVPRNEDAREECFFRQLPRALMSFLGISDAAAEAVLLGVIGCRSLVSVDNILEAAGIVEVDEISRRSNPMITSDTTATAGIPEEVVDAIDHTVLNISTPGRDAEEVQPQRALSRNSLLSNWNPFANRQLLTPPRNYGESGNYYPTIEPSSPSPYLSLLERVIHTASSMSIPRNRSHAFAEIQGVFHPRIVLPGSGFGPRSPERDRKIGAAGELLVSRSALLTKNLPLGLRYLFSPKIFELLSRLELPDFSAANWKSTIRNEVCVHEKYRDLGAWSGRETADITYHDIGGRFTELLVQNGYLNAMFAGLNISYYLEVKTTSSDCDEQFYMSKAQYKRVRDLPFLDQ